MPTSSKIFKDLLFFYPHDIEFQKLYEEIFKQHCYYIESELPVARILDVGGHIGLSSLYFNSLFPNAKITVFEPIPSLLNYLQRNIDQNRVANIEVVPKAVWSYDGEMTMYIDVDDSKPWLSTSSVIEGAWTTRQPTKPITVQTIKLSHFLTEPIDILKIDAEGAETEILKECQSELHWVRNIFVEFHANRIHRPDTVISILKNAGFKLKISHDEKEVMPEQMTRRKPTLYFIEGSRG